MYPSTPGCSLRGRSPSSNSGDGEVLTPERCTLQRVGEFGRRSFPSSNSIGNVPYTVARETKFVIGEG